MADKDITKKRSDKPTDNVPVKTLDPAEDPRPSRRNMALHDFIMQQRSKRGQERLVQKVIDPYENCYDYVKLSKKETGLCLSLNDHYNPWDDNHPETPVRFTQITEQIKKLELDKRLIIKLVCSQIADIPDSVILDNHSELMFENLRKVCLKHLKDWKKESMNWDSVYINSQTFNNAVIAVQTVLNLAHSVCKGEVGRGFAIVRPPGHHAQHSDYNGYCFFNNVAVTAKSLIKEGLANKILIVDFDVHHGQGTQDAFYNRDDVLYFSIHRYEHGTFWPNLPRGNSSYVGEGKGVGFNVNVPLNDIGCTDTDYFAIVFNLLLPIAYEFNPDLIVLSAGYDACIGCPEGRMKVSPAFYGHLVNLLSGLANGRIVAALEGGYFIPSLVEGVIMTIKAMLGDPPGYIEPLGMAKPSVIDTINKCKFHLRPFWNCFKATPVFKYPKNKSEVIERFTIKTDEHISEEIYMGVEPEAPFPIVDCYAELTTEEIEQSNLKVKELRSRYHTKSSGHKYVGYSYDDAVLLHKSSQSMPECPERLLKINEILTEYRLLGRMTFYPSLPITVKDLQMYHSAEYVDRVLVDRELPKQNDLYDNEFTLESVCAAVGSCISLVDKIIKRKIDAGVALVRPPGHHAKHSTTSGFCFINNAYVAAIHALENDANIKKVLIVDFDIHHGDGTQSLTYCHKDIMYLSVHRYDNTNYFPHSKEADETYTGNGLGKGYNVNIPFNEGKMGNSEYLHVFLTLVLPIAYSYGPDLVIVSAGFDAGINDSLGGYNVYPEMYGHFIQLLKSLALGRMLFVLEGGYNPSTLGYSVAMCIKALLGDPIPMPTFEYPIKESVIDTTLKVVKAHMEFWPILKVNKKIGQILINNWDRDAIVEILAQSKLNQPENLKLKKILHKNESRIADAASNTEATIKKLLEMRIHNQNQ